MTASSRIVTRVVSDKTERYTIWDNFERHVQELRAIGATDADVESLRIAADSVDVLEKQVAVDEGRNPELQDTTLASIVSPYTCANGWVIQPPSACARNWARVATLKVTGGASPDDSHGLKTIVLVALWALREFGDGHAQAIMHVTMTGNRMAMLVMQFNALVDDYVRLMGIDTQKKRMAAETTYRDLAAQIRTRLSARSTVPS